jgi:5S rRNA maturation endonuclease (ribonuclease M5)
VKVTKGGRELWYPSPFRKEKDASFHTSFLGGKWIWKDFDDIGGNVIDFVMRHQNLQFKEALAFLRNVYQASLFESSSRAGGSSRKLIPNLSSFRQHTQQINTTPETRRDLEFLEAHDIRNPAILSYLEEERKIPVELARRYLKEVKYRNIPKNKTFFAFGMENESGGYEIRAASDQYKFKSALIRRDITVIRGREPGREKVSVFEGMTDFLSLLVLQKTDRLEGDAIIMHSVSTYNRTVKYIEDQGYEQVFTFLDNDRTGEKCTAKFERDLALSKVYPQNQTFRPYKDVNEALVAGMRKNHPGLDFQPL